MILTLDYSTVGVSCERSRSLLSLVQMITSPYRGDPIPVSLLDS